MELRPLELTLCFKNFEKMHALSLYWLAAQQQTSTFRRQKFDFLHSKFSAEFTELSLRF